MKKYFSTLAISFTIAVLVSGCALISPSHHTTEEYTPFFAAASGGDLAEIQREVGAKPELVNATEWDKSTALHDAVGQNQIEVASYLLDKGAKVNAVTQDGLTALHMAAQNGNVPVIELLIRSGASLNPVDAKGWTPTDRAEKWDHPGAVELLKARGGHEGR